MNTTLFPRPDRFIPVDPSRLAWAELRWEGPWGQEPQRGGGAVKAAGRRYERKVHCRLGSMYSPESSLDGALYTPAQWIEFRERGQSRSRWAQPDGLLLNLSRGLLVVVEVKLRHVVTAWWWLRGIYGPLLHFLFPKWTIAYLEVVRYYDPAVRWPEPIRLVREPSLVREGQFGVHIWSGAA